MGCDDYGDTTAGTGAPGYAEALRTHSIAAGGCQQPMLGKIGMAPEDDHTMAGILGGVNRQRAIDIDKAPMVTVDVTGETSCNYEFLNLPNPQAARVVTNILPKVVEMYLNKSRDYGGNVGALAKLGPKATFVDIWRKIGKLKRCLWDDEPLKYEQPDEILADLVGHIVIILDEMNQARVK